MLFLINPWKFHPQLPPPPTFLFFLNSPMAGVKVGYTYLTIFVDIGYVVRQTLKILGVTKSSHTIFLNVVITREPMSAPCL